MKNPSSGSYFPVLIDLTKFDIVIIGAGNIATRKVQNLLEFGAKMKIIAPEISKEILELSISNEIQIIQRNYEYGDIPIKSLVFCSTANPEVDKLIKKECDEKQALLNVADVPELCNFIMPATIKHGDLTISVASQGKAPFLVREIRKKLSILFSPQTAEYVEIASEFRNKLIETEIYYDIDRREELIQAFLKLDIDNIIKTQGKETALKIASDIISEK